MADHQHVMLPGSSRPAPSGAQRLRAVNPDETIEVTLTLRGPALPDADHLPQKTLSPDELRAQYGARPEDAAKVTQILEGYGLTVTDTSLTTRSMRVRGPISLITQAFPANLAVYHSAEQGELRGREGTINVPAPLDGIITGVFGLDERRVAGRKPVGRLLAPTQEAHAAHQTALQPLTPADLEQRYNFPPGQAAGQKIGIAEFGGGYFASDVSDFCTRHGRPVPTVTTVAVGFTPPPPTFNQVLSLPQPEQDEVFAESGEVMMDVEIIAALCPKAAISVYFAKFTEQGWVDLLNRAITDQPVALSISWGLAEDAPDWSPGAINAINNALAAAALVGITVCVASGDDGSGDGQDDVRAHVDFPGSSPFVLGVGGTMLTGTVGHATERTWFKAPGRRNGHGAGATGGGVSVSFNRPSWQNVAIPSLNPHAIDGRVVPDIAALAGAPGYDLTFAGEVSPNGGTSASAPLWAALIARINAVLPANKRQRFLTPLLYQAGANGKPRGQTACRDITLGHNASSPFPGAGYEAQQGFDAVTGWGVPNGVLLQGALG